MNLALAPMTLTTGCSPIVLVTTPPHPASKARRMLLSDSVGGAEERRNGFSNWIPVKLTDLADIDSNPRACCCFPSTCDRRQRLCSRNETVDGSPADAGRRWGCGEAVGGGVWGDRA